MRVIKLVYMRRREPEKNTQVNRLQSAFGAPINMCYLNTSIDERV